MRVLEIKNSLVKISYEVEDNLALSGFVIVEDANTPYVAQVVNLKTENGRNLAVLKLLFTFNEEGVLRAYDGTIPSSGATVTKLPPEELLSILPLETPVYIGALAQQDIPFKLDSSVLQSNLLICSNNVDNTSKILSNILPQMVDEGKKVVLLDVNGDFASDDNFIFGKNFKLPLNTQFLDFIFEHDLEGVEAVSKAVIADIFKELRDYIGSLPQGYLPIDTFIDVVDAQYRETGIAELILLKNKLEKYRDANVFAAGKDDVSMFRSKVAHSDSLIVDISVVEVNLQKLLIPYLFDCISTVNSDTFVLLTMNNDVADKKLLRKTLEFRNIYTTIICSHEFKYLHDLKQIIQNLILFAPQLLQHDFASYNTFLSKLNNDEFIVFGPATRQIPFIVQLKPYEELIEAEQNANSAQEGEHASDEQASDAEDSSSNNEEEFEGGNFEKNSQSVIDVEPEEPVLIQPEEDITTDFEADTSEPSLSESAGDEILEPFQNSEIDLYDADETSEFEQEALNDREALEEQVAKDVDAVFYNKIEEENLDNENYINPDILNDENALSDSDLDYIQSMPLDNDYQEVYSSEDFSNIPEPAQTVEELEGEVLDEGVIEEFPIEDAQLLSEENEGQESQMVPIYTPEEFKEEEQTEEIFQAGDVVAHPKYGQGVVEKMINYGNKTLCSISFVNIGRRLLDPNLSELTLLSRDGVAFSGG